MFAKPSFSVDPKLLVRLALADTALAGRLTRLLERTGRFRVEPAANGLAVRATFAGRTETASLLVLQLDPGRQEDLAGLEKLRAATPAPPVIVLADGLGEAAIRRLLKLQIADWLSTDCTEREFLTACEQALRPAKVSAVQSARVTTFVSAVGGAGATTLSLAAASALARSSHVGFAGCCAVDLNFESGVLADYLDLTPNLQLEEIAALPDRLDGHLLEVMLSRHTSGLAVLAAPQSTALGGSQAIRADIVGRLLDLASLHFKHVVIDMPRLMLPLCKNIVHGTDALYIVTELTVIGLRQARRLTDMLGDDCRSSTKRSIIVNKVPWFGGGVKKGDAREALGDRLAGFIRDETGLVHEAQNRGLLISQMKKRNRIEAELRHILLPELGELNQMAERQK